MDVGRTDTQRFRKGSVEEPSSLHHPYSLVDSWVLVNSFVALIVTEYKSGRLVYDRDRPSYLSNSKTEKRG